MKINFMIIGAQKCGTTTLFDILDSHPSIVGCCKKEPQFFSDSKDWKKELHYYENLFDLKETKDVLYFEGSTSYTFYPLKNLEIWNDIFEYNPDMKFLYLVRNPIDRIISSYIHTYKRGYIDSCIEEAIIANRLFIDVSRYYTQIKPYIEKFGGNSVLIIDFDDFNHNRTDVLRKISQFLGVDFDKFKNYQNVHRNISIGIQTRHHQFDKIALRLEKLSNVVPTYFVKALMPIWKAATRKPQRLFTEKPKLTNVHKRVIIDMLDLEIDALQKIMNKDISYWKFVE